MPKSSPSSSRANVLYDSPTKTRLSVFDRLGVKASSNKLPYKETCSHWALNGNCPNGKSCKFSASHTTLSHLKAKGVATGNTAKGWHTWDPDVLKDADPDVLEKRRQELKRELDYQMKIEDVKKKHPQKDPVTNAPSVSAKTHVFPKSTIRRKESSCSSSLDLSLSTSDGSSSSGDENIKRARSTSSISSRDDKKMKPSKSIRKSKHSSSSSDDARTACRGKSANRNTKLRSRTPPLKTTLCSTISKNSKILARCNDSGRTPSPRSNERTNRHSDDRHSRKGNMKKEEIRRSRSRDSRRSNRTKSSPRARPSTSRTASRRSSSPRRGRSVDKRARSNSRERERVRRAQEREAAREKERAEALARCQERQRERERLKLLALEKNRDIRQQRVNDESRARIERNASRSNRDRRNDAKRDNVVDRKDRPGERDNRQNNRIYARTIVRADSNNDFRFIKNKRLHAGGDTPDEGWKIRNKDARIFPNNRNRCLDDKRKPFIKQKVVKDIGKAEQPTTNFASGRNKKMEYNKDSNNKPRRDYKAQSDNTRLINSNNQQNRKRAADDNNTDVQRAEKRQCVASLEDDLSEISDEADEILDNVEAIRHQSDAPQSEQKDKDEIIPTINSPPFLKDESRSNSVPPTKEEKMFDSKDILELDFEEISDDELDDDLKAKTIGDVLGVDWSSLSKSVDNNVAESRSSPKSEQQPTVGDDIQSNEQIQEDEKVNSNNSDKNVTHLEQIRKRWNAYNLLYNELGISKSLLNNNELYNKIVQNAEKDDCSEEPPPIEMGSVALLHIMRQRETRHRNRLFGIGIGKDAPLTALSARRDLQIRRYLCNMPLNSAYLETKLTYNADNFNAAVNLLKEQTEAPCTLVK